MTKRAELYRARQEARAALAELDDDIAAMDSTLRILGYEHDPDDAMPTVAQNPMFKRGQLRRLIYEALREAGPLSCREIAARISDADGKELSAVAKRVDRSLYKAFQRRQLQRQKAGTGEWVWSTPY